MTEVANAPAAPARETVLLPAGQFVFRCLDLDTDLARHARLVNEAEAVDRVDRGTTEEEARFGLSNPEHDLARDRWVVEEPGNSDRLIAFGAIWKGAKAPGGWLNLLVHPAWRRHGLGGTLLDRCLARARAKGADHLGAGADDALPTGHAFLQHRGFRQDATWVQMRAPAGVHLAEPVYPPGYTVRPYAEVRDPLVLLEALNRGFIGHHGHHDETLDELQHWLNLPRTRPEGIFLAFGPAGDVAGFCWTDINEARSARFGEPLGYIDTLAVVPEHRRHGLGRALLLTGMRWLRAQGQPTVDLDAWGENAMALPLYLQVGFAVRRSGVEYRRELAPHPSRLTPHP